MFECCDLLPVVNDLLFLLIFPFIPLYVVVFLLFSAVILSFRHSFLCSTSLLSNNNDYDRSKLQLTPSQGSLVSLTVQLDETLVSSFPEGGFDPLPFTPKSELVLPGWGIKGADDSLPDLTSFPTQPCPYPIAC